LFCFVSTYNNERYMASNSQIAAIAESLARAQADAGVSARISFKILSDRHLSLSPKFLLSISSLLFESSCTYIYACTGDIIILQFKEKVIYRPITPVSIFQVIFISSSTDLNNSSIST